MKSGKSARILCEIRFWYILVYALNFMCLSLSPYRLSGLMNHDSLVFTGLGVLGALLLAVDFFTRRNMLRVPNAELLLAFFVIALISCVLNRAYSFTGSVKCLIWMAIQILYVGAVDVDLPREVHKKHIAILGHVLILFWLVCVVISLRMYIIQYGIQTDIMVGEKLLWRTVGYLEGRLFGIFIDPNYAALISLFCILLALYFLTQPGCALWRRILYGISIAVQFLYVVLSASRTAELCMVGAAFFGGCFILPVRPNRKKLVHLALCGLVGLLCAAVSFGALTVVRAGAAYLPSLYADVSAGAGQTQMKGPLSQPDATPAPETAESAPNAHTPAAHPLEAVDMTRPDAEKEDYSNNRFAIWADYLRVVRSAPVLGVGPRGYESYAAEHFPDSFIVQRQYVVHNGYLVLFVGTGIVGGLLMLVWFALAAISVLIWLVKNRKDTPEGYRDVLWLTMILVIGAVAAFPFQILFYVNDEVTIVLWVVFGYVMALIRGGRSDGPLYRLLAPRS